SYVFGQTPEILKMVVSEPGVKVILFQKHGLHPSQKMEALRQNQKALGPIKESGPYFETRDFQGRQLRVVDLVTMDRRDLLQKNLVKALAKGDDPDVIISVDIGKLGLDYPACNTVILEGSRSSVTDIVQRIGRLIRAFPGKERVRVFFALEPI